MSPILSFSAKDKCAESVGRWASVQKYIQPLAELLNAEILVIDTKGICVAGTARNVERFGTKVPDDNAISYSLRTGESTFVLDPGCDDVCRNCAKREGCAEMANFTGAVFVEGKIIAVVQFVAYTLRQRVDLLSKVEQAFDLLQHVVKFVWQHEMRQVSSKKTKHFNTFQNFIGESEAIKKLKNKIVKIASTDSTVLIQGESGTGKELVALAIHDHSQRKSKAFVPINCGAIPENLMESELFGYVGGAFSGADKGGRIGLLEQAHGGTLFLDEISEMPLSLQVKLLRTLQEGTLRRVGATEQKVIDIRVIAATNKNLRLMVEEGLFREDLFFRLDVVPVFVPPLRERKEDIALLTAYFLQQFSKAQNRSFRMSTKLHELFEKYPWPGNVRELKNFVEFGVSLCENDVLTLEVMRPRFSAYAAQSESRGGYHTSNYANDWESEKKVIAKEERAFSSSFEKLTSNIPLLSAKELREKEEISYLLQKYAKVKGGKKKVAEELSMSPATLYRKLQKFGL